MTKDYADFLESLNREGVAYVVIGGMAVGAHVPYRTTRDLDDLIEGLVRSGTAGLGDAENVTLRLESHPDLTYNADLPSTRLS